MPIRKGLKCKVQASVHCTLHIQAHSFISYRFLLSPVESVVKSLETTLSAAVISLSAGMPRALLRFQETLLPAKASRRFLQHL